MSVSFTNPWEEIPDFVYSKDENVKGLMNILLDGNLKFPNTPGKCRTLLTAFADDRQRFIPREKIFNNICKIMSVDPAAAARQEQNGGINCASNLVSYENFRPDCEPIPVSEVIKDADKKGVTVSYNDFLVTAKSSVELQKASLVVADPLQETSVGSKDDSVLNNNNDGSLSPERGTSPEFKGEVSPNISKKNDSSDTFSLSTVLKYGNAVKTASPQAPRHEESKIPPTNRISTMTLAKSSSVAPKMASVLNNHQMTNNTPVTSTSPPASKLSTSRKARFTGDAAVEKLRRRNEEEASK